MPDGSRMPTAGPWPGETSQEDWKDIEWTVSFHPFHDEVPRRVQSATLLGQAIPVLSAEDLVLFKVLFDRPKDWLDIANMAAARPLDRIYVRRWATELLPADDSRLARIEKILGPGNASPGV